MTADARLAVNASIVGGDPTGLGIHSIKLIRALHEIRNDFFVYAFLGGAIGSVRARIGRTPRATRLDYGASTWRRPALEVSRVLDGTVGQSETRCPALPLHDGA